MLDRGVKGHLSEPTKDSTERVINTHEPSKPVLASSNVTELCMNIQERPEELQKLRLKVQEKRKALQDKFSKISSTLNDQEIVIWKDRFQSQTSSIRKKQEGEIIKEMEDDLTNFQEMAITELKERNNLSLDSCTKDNEDQLKDIPFGSCWLQSSIDEENDSKEEQREVNEREFYLGNNIGNVFKEEEEQVLNEEEVNSDMFEVERKEARPESPHSSVEESSILIIDDFSIQYLFHMIILE